MATIPAGPDFFETKEEGTAFPFTNYARVPEHFFGQGSKPFLGVVRFRGEAVKSFTDPSGNKYNTGTADTVVLRKQDVSIAGNSGSGTTSIELVVLSLVSSKAIEVEIGNKKHKWQVRLTVSKSKPSTGSMTITQTSASGGVWASELNVVPLFTFVGPGGEEKQLDFGQMQIQKEKEPLFKQLNTLMASDVAWQFGSEEGGQASSSAAKTFVIPESVVHPQHFILQVVAPVAK
ncbi:MAG TPA: hypothetical protein VHU83_22490 [Bryobacteraceae bacterium]|jgi:hypothetical protein|nr:hypothetical protein [Bryobacteraceae bacterium]